MVYLATGNPSSHNNGSSSSIGGGGDGNGTTSASERSSHNDRDLEDCSDGEREGTIGVGKDYQASIPPYIEENREFYPYNMHLEVLSEPFIFCLSRTTSTLSSQTATPRSNAPRELCSCGLRPLTSQPQSVSPKVVNAYFLDNE